MRMFFQMKCQDLDCMHELIMIMRVGVLLNNKYFLTYWVGVFHIYLYLCA